MQIFARSTSKEANRSIMCVCPRAQKRYGPDRADETKGRDAVDPVGRKSDQTERDDDEVQPARFASQPAALRPTAVRTTLVAHHVRSAVSLARLSRFLQCVSRDPSWDKYWSLGYRGGSAHGRRATLPGWLHTHPSISQMAGRLQRADC